MPLQEIVQRRETSKTDRRGLARRLEQRQARRHQCDAARECDQHAATGDQAQLRQATIAGGQKWEESDGGGRGGQLKRISRLAGSPPQSPLKVRVLVPFGAVTED